MIEQGHLTVLDTATVVIGLMQLVEEYDDLHGSEKKDLILKVLEKYDVCHPDEENLLTSSLAGFVTALVSVDRGELVIKIEPEKCLASCFTCLLSSAQVKRRERCNVTKRKKTLAARKLALEQELASLEKK
jgi:hypothetical protein